MSRRRFVRVVAPLLLAALAGTACTGVRVRDFTRESYQPSPWADSTFRVYPQPLDSVWDALAAALRDRGARIELQDRSLGTLAAAVLWPSPADAAAAVDLGHVHRVVTRTERTYKSYSLFDYDCNACVVRNGEVVDQQTQIVEDGIVPLDPGRYRLEAWVRAELSSSGSGTQLVLSLDIEPEPREPPELVAASRGVLEQQLLLDVEKRLTSSREDLR